MDKLLTFVALCMLAGCGTGATVHNLNDPARESERYTLSAVAGRSGWTLTAGDVGEAWVGPVIRK